MTQQHTVISKKKNQQKDDYLVLFFVLSEYHYLHAMGNVFIKNAFFKQPSKSVEMKMLFNFLVNSALMVAMLVKLLLFLIASKTSPVSSLEVSFSSSKYALCY